MRIALVCLGLAALAAAGCVSVESQRRMLRSPSALERARAAVWLADARDAGAVHHIVDLLDDRDEVVRMYAILALSRLCGETRGYQYYASEEHRAAAVKRWRDALREGQVEVTPPISGVDGGAVSSAGALPP